MIIRLGIVIVVVALAAGSIRHAAAQEPSIAAAGIVTGDCGAADMVYPLVVPELPAGPFLGSSTALPAGQSFSAVPVSLNVLMEQEASIVLVDQGDIVAACAPVGGITDADGSIVIGLTETDQSGVTGIAYLSPAPGGAQTNVSLFAVGIAPAVLTDEAADAGSGVVAVAEVAAPETESDIVAAPTLSDADRGYVAYLVENIQAMTDSAFRFSELFSNPRVGQDNWTISVATEIALWRSLYVDAQGVTAPPRFAEVHATFVELLRLMDSASYDFTAGLDTLDGALLEQGAGKVNQATALMNEITRMLTEIQQELGE